MFVVLGMGIQNLSNQNSLLLINGVLFVQVYIVQFSGLCMVWVGEVNIWSFVFGNIGSSMIYFEYGVCDVCFEVFSVSGEIVWFDFINIICML